MEIVLVDKNNSKWFEQMLPPRERRLLQRDEEVFALGAVVECVACGIVLCRFNGLYLDVIYLVVSDEYRRKKVATGLIDYLCGLARGKQIPVSCYFSAQSPQDEFHLFFGSLQSFSVTKVEHVKSFTIPYAMLAESIVLDAIKSREKTSRLFFELVGREQKVLLESFLRSGIHFLEDFEYERQKYIPQLCLVHIEGKDPAAALFMERIENSGDVGLSFAYSNENGTLCLMEEFLEAREYLLKHMKESDCIRIDTVNDAAFRLLRKLYPASRAADAGLYVADWNMVG